MTDRYKEKSGGPLKLVPLDPRKGAVLRWRPAAPLLALGLLIWACGRDDAIVPDGEALGPPESLRSLLIEGVANAEIQEWPRALELFQQAVVLAPEEPVAVFDVAVANYHSGDAQAASKQLERMPETTPPWLLARVSYLRGKLAAEEGDRQAVQDAYREAARLDPAEAVYPHALAEYERRQPRRQGALLGQAYELWPENARLAADFALWALRQGDAATRLRGLAAVEAMVATVGESSIRAYLEKGRAEIERHPDQKRVPPTLRVVLNLMLNGKQFRGDVTELTARQEVMPLAEPVAARPPRKAPPSPEVHFTATELTALPPLTDGERVVAAVVVDDAGDQRFPGRRQAAGTGSGREAAVALLSDRGLYFLPREGDETQLLAELSPGHAPFVPALIAGDLDDDGRPELAVANGSGLRLWGRRDDSPAWSEHALIPELAEAGALRELAMVDFEHDGDLDLVALDDAGRPVLVTHRGEAGWGPPLTAPLPVDEPLRRLAFTDLDGDADQDLVAATATELLVLRNWRQGQLSLHAREALPSPPRQLVPLDYDGDGASDLVVLHRTVLGFWRGNGRAGLDRDTVAEESAGDRVAFLDGDLRRLAVTDVDLDGDPDLVVAGDAGLVLLENLGDSRFEARQDLFGEPIAGLLPLDLDGDRDPDLLAWGDARPRGFLAAGAEDQGWIAVGLRGIAGKVPLDGRGVRLEVKFAGRTQTFEPGRANVILGLGDEKPAVIKATWPNGISEYLFAPATHTRHVLQLTMRIEGSCPFLYASDGNRLRFVTDILSLAPLGMLAGDVPRSPQGHGSPGRYVPADPEEYLRLPDWVRPRRGELELAITEELREVTYLDQAELVVVDAPDDVLVMNGEQWLEGMVEGLALRLLTPPVPPAAVYDHLGHDALERIRDQDHRYLAPLSGKRRYQGAMEPHRLTVELPPEVASAERPALVMVGWLHWGNTSTNVARAQDPRGAPLFPYLEVGDGRGGWRPAAAAVGLPAGKTKPVVVDLTGALNPGDPRLRITTDFEVSWDLLAAATLRLEADTPHRVHRLAARTARLRYGGFSRWFRPSADGPYLFDYHDRRPYPWRLDPTGRDTALSWQEHEGYYTAFGPVEELLENADDRYVVFGSGEEVALGFDLTRIPPLPSGWRRTFFLHSEGWEKDGDPNVACSQTVLPLPYRGMPGYPCPRAVPGPPGPDGGGAERSRWVARDRLTHRVAAWAAGPSNDLEDTFE